MDPEFVGKLREAFLESLDLPADTVVGVLAFGQHPHWDSLGHMTLVAAIEERFDFTLDGDEVMRLETFAAAVEILAEALRRKRGSSQKVGVRKSEKTPP